VGLFPLKESVRPGQLLQPGRASAPGVNLSDRQAPAANNGQVQTIS